MHKRTLSPSPGGNQDGIDKSLEVSYKTGSFICAVSKIVVFGQFAENKWSFHISVGINQKAKVVTKSDISKYDISRNVKRRSPIRLQFFMTFLDVTKIHNFLSVLKYAAKIVIISEIMASGRHRFLRPAFRPEGLSRRGRRERDEECRSLHIPRQGRLPDPATVGNGSPVVSWPLL